jgi:N-acetylneuraminic acid mutarotase
MKYLPTKSGLWTIGFGSQSWINRWSTGASMITSRRQPFGWAINWILIVAWGFTTVSTAVTEGYNPVTNTWSSLASMNLAKRNGASAVLEWELYCIAWSTTAVTNDVQKYNPTTNSWTTLNNYPISAEAFPSSVVGTSIYCFGGFTTVNVNNCYKYTKATDSWASIANFPTTKGNASASAYGNNIYIMGWSTPRTTNYEYDTVADTFTSKTALPLGKQLGIQATIWEYIYITGGTDGSVRNQTYRYSPYLNNMVTLANIPTARYAWARWVIDWKLYITGWTSTGTNNFAILDIYTP